MAASAQQAMPVVTFMSSGSLRQLAAVRFCGRSVRALYGQFIGAVIRCSYTATVTVSYGFKNESFGFVLGSGTAT
jgi:hypothetical protein